VSSNAFSLFRADAFKLHSFEEIKTQVNGMDIEVGDPGVPSLSVSTRKWQKFLFPPAIEEIRASDEGKKEETKVSQTRKSVRPTGR
jgi:hypothetical protein